MELVEPHFCLALDACKSFNPVSFGELPCSLVSEAYDHSLILDPFMRYVKRPPSAFGGVNSEGSQESGVISQE